MEANQPTIEQLLKNMEKISGVSKEESAEAVMTAHQAKAATIFAAVVDF
jgi:hypothetical protein